jgi:sugar lactone lactonase YvrE
MKRFLLFVTCFLLSLLPGLALAQNTVIFLTSGTSWTVPSNWSNANNTVEVIGSGGAHKSSSATAGAGGGSYSKANNLALTPNSSVPYNIGASGLVSPGESTWFGSTSRSSALVAAQGGCNVSSSSDCTNSTSANIGSVIYAGGKGGNDGYLAGFAAGGGGAAGPHGEGGRGHDSEQYSGGAGGFGDNGYGGAGGAHSNGPASPGGAGAEYTATAGGTAGSGGGGGAGANRNGGGSTGGAYGGGAGGGNTSGGVPGGNGLIALTYTPNPAIFVTNLTSAAATAYSLGSNGNVLPVSGSSGPGLSGPVGIATDSTGKIYVANEDVSSVTVYAAGASGNASPIASIAGVSTGLISPTGVALDSSRNIYVANAGSLAGLADSITVYAAASNGNVTPTATITGSATGLAYPASLTLDSHGNIYVANSGSQVGGVDSITVYPAGSNGNVSPSTTISGANTGLVVPWGLAVASNGNLYVANDGSAVGGSDSITVYSAGSNGNSSPSATITGSSTGLDSPGGIALDSSGNLYVTNDGDLIGNADSITVYAPGSNGNALPSNTLFAVDLATPAGIAVDSSGNLYVANDGSTQGLTGSITVYPPNSSQIKSQIETNTGIQEPNGIALDSGGNIYVTNAATDVGGPNDNVLIYPPGSYANGAPSATIVGANTGLTLPFGIAMNPNGNLYVTNTAGGPDGDGSITVYPAGSTGNVTPTATISDDPNCAPCDNTGLSSPNGIALDSSGNIYVANSAGGPDGLGSVTIYPASSNGNVTPTATISDKPSCAPCDNTKLSSPYGVAVDSAGKIYVVNAAGGSDGLGSVTVYPPLGSSTGTLNEAPSATISGSNTSDITGFNFPAGITLDLAGNIYVANSGNSIPGNGASGASITVYSAGSNGNVAPIATITGLSTGLGLPQGIAIGPAGSVHGPARRPHRHKKPRRSTGRVRMVVSTKLRERLPNKAG